MFYFFLNTITNILNYPMTLNMNLSCISIILMCFVKMAISYLDNKDFPYAFYLEIVITIIICSVILFVYNPLVSLVFIGLCLMASIAIPYLYSQNKIHALFMEEEWIEKYKNCIYQNKTMSDKQKINLSLWINEKNNTLSQINGISVLISDLVVFLIVLSCMFLYDSGNINFVTFIITFGFVYLLKPYLYKANRIDSQKNILFEKDNIDVSNY